MRCINNLYLDVSDFTFEQVSHFCQINFSSLDCLLASQQHQPQCWLTPNHTLRGFYKLINTFRLRQNGRHFPDDISKCFFLNENVSITIKISLKFVPKGPINNIPALVQIMAWRHPGDKPLSEPMMVSLPMHICVTRPQRVKQHISTNTSTNNREHLQSSFTYFILNIWFLIPILCYVCLHSLRSVN